MDLSQIVEAVNAALNAHNASLGTTLVPDGKRLAVALATAVLAWRMVRSMLTDEGPYGVISEIVGVVVPTGLVLWFLLNWNWIWNVSLIGGFDYISARLSGSGSATSGVSVGMNAILKTALALFESMKPHSGGVVEFASNFPSWLIASGFKFIVMGLLMACAVVFGGVMILSQILVGIALVIGPVLVPWLIFEPTSFLFWGWVKFLISAALYKVVGVLLLTYCSKLLPFLTEAAQGAADPAAVDMVSASALLFLAAVILMLTLQAPAIASSILNGHNSASFRLPRPSSSGPSQSGSKDSGKKASGPSQSGGKDSGKKE